MDLLQLLPLINIIGFVIMVAVTFYNSKRSGEGTVRTEVMDLLEKQVEALKDEILRLREKNHELGNSLQVLTLQIGQFKGEMAIKDKQIEEFTRIFQNRDPEMITILNEIKEFMKLLHDKVNANEQRNTQIDRSTKADKGHVLRKEV